MMKWKLGVAAVLLSGALAGCNNGTNDNANRDVNNRNTRVNEQGVSDYGTPYHDNGINDNYNGAEGRYMNGNNGNVDTGNNGATTNGGNNMNGAGGNHGEPGNNNTNRNGGAGAGTHNGDHNVLDNAATDVERAADRIVDDGRDIVDDTVDHKKVR